MDTCEYSLDCRHRVRYYLLPRKLQENPTRRYNVCLGHFRLWLDIWLLNGSDAVEVRVVADSDKNKTPEQIREEAKQELEKIKAEKEASDD